MKATINSFRKAIKNALVKESAKTISVKIVPMPSLGAVGNIYETKPTSKGSKKSKKIKDSKNVRLGAWHDYKAGK